MPRSHPARRARDDGIAKILIGSTTISEVERHGKDRGSRPPAGPQAAGLRASLGRGSAGCGGRPVIERWAYSPTKQRIPRRRSPAPLPRTRRARPVTCSASRARRPRHCRFSGRAKAHLRTAQTRRSSASSPFTPGCETSFDGVHSRAFDVAERRGPASGMSRNDLTPA